MFKDYYAVRAVAYSCAAIAVVVGMERCSAHTKNQEKFKIENCGAHGLTWTYDLHGQVYCEVKKEVKP